MPKRRGAKNGVQEPDGSGTALPAADSLTIQLDLECAVSHGVSSQQISGMFGLDLSAATREHICLAIPRQSEDWRIGAIVGPSGSGKSTLARYLFGDIIAQPQHWEEDKAVIDHFEHLPIKQVVRMLTAVGFGSTPSWVRPFQVLSNGEQMRARLVRMIVEAQTRPPQDHAPWYCLLPDDADRRLPLVVCDEFTSVIDRQTAKAVSAGIAKALKKGLIPGRFVAVTCHYDIIDWLTPDWVIDMANRTFARRSLQRPPIRLHIFPAKREAWSVFKRHHYLSHSLPAAGRYFLAFWNDQAVAFCAVGSNFLKKHFHRVCRLVVLPDYQGLGIGGAFLDAIGELYHAEKRRLSISTSHPAIVAYCGRSPRWRLTASYISELTRYKDEFKQQKPKVSFEYVGG